MQVLKLFRGARSREGDDVVKMPMWVEGKAGRKEIKDAVWAAVGLKTVRDGMMLKTQ